MHTVLNKCLLNNSPHPDPLIAPVPWVGAGMKELGDLPGARTQAAGRHGSVPVELTRSTCTGLNSVSPHPLPPISVHGEPQDVALFGNRIFADVVQLR